MKTVSLLSMVLSAVCLVGCENTELVTCQQEKQALQTQVDTVQQQLDQAKTTIADKDSRIAALETKNLEDQKIAMKSITTMMQKQAAKNEEVMAIKEKEIAELHGELNSTKAELEKLKGLYETAKTALENAAKEKQDTTQPQNPEP